VVYTRNTRSQPFHFRAMPARDPDYANFSPHRPTTPRPYYPTNPILHRFHPPDPGPRPLDTQSPITSALVTQSQFTSHWVSAGQQLISTAIQPLSAKIYAEKFRRWCEFTSQAGFADPYLTTIPTISVIAVICAFAAWARHSGTWGGSTCIQALSAIRHSFRSTFHDFSAFNSSTVSTLRKSLLLTDRFDDARANHLNRLPFSLDMVSDAARASSASNNMITIMTGTAIQSASFMLLRVSEYATASAATDTSVASDHRLLASNVLFYTTNDHRPLTTQQLNAQRRARKTDHIIKSVTFTLASSKADSSGDGVTFVYSAEDFDANDPATFINMLQRWAYLANHSDDDPFFSFRDRAGTVTHLTATSVTSELRRIATIHLIPSHQLNRVTPHSIRIGMATHLHNQGITTTVILQMGRWSQKSTAAPKYQRLSVGACAQVARSTSAEIVRSAHTSAHTVQSLVRPAHFDKVLRATAKKRQQRTDSTSSTPPPSTHQPPTNTLPGTARWGGSLSQNCANNNKLPLEVQVFTRFPHTGPHEVNTHLSSTKNDISNAKRQSCGLRKFR